MTKLDISSTAIEKGLDMLKGFVEKLAGGAVEEAGLLFADKVRLRRLKNQIQILEKAKKIAHDGGIDLKQINLKILVPLLDNCSLEEEESLQDKWAKLICNYADSQKQYTSSIYPFILNQITTEDISYLVILRGFNTRRYKKFEVSGITISNLVRLGLIERVSTAGYVYEGEHPIYYKITELGKEFLTACE